MCEGLSLRPTGSKGNLCHRIAEHWEKTKDPRALLENKIEANVGPITHDDGLPAAIRRHYVDDYSALDRFDRLFYEMTFLSHPHDWESHFRWGLIHCAVINARAAWCVRKNQRVPLQDFLRELIDEAAKQDLPIKK